MAFREITRLFKAEKLIDNSQNTAGKPTQSSEYEQEDGGHQYDDTDGQENEKPSWRPARDSRDERVISAVFVLLRHLGAHRC